MTKNKLTFQHLTRATSFVVEETEHKATQRNFLELLMIPGCLLMFVHITLVRVSSTARMAGISSWIMFNVRYTLLYKSETVVCLFLHCILLPI